MEALRNWKPFEGATLLLPSGPLKHLFVVLTEPCPEGNVVIVNVSSIENGRYHDPTVTFQGGEHSFFKHPTFAYYAMAEIRSAVSLRRGVLSGNFIPRESVSAAVFERICDGLLESEDVPQKVVRYFRARLAFK